MKILCVFLVIVSVICQAPNVALSAVEEHSIIKPMPRSELLRQSRVKNFASYRFN